MGENSAIAWTHHTFNPWIGCSEVGPGCDGCYARELDARYRWGGAAHWGPGVPRYRTSEVNWRKPIAWDKRAAKTGVRERVFCASLADVFDNEVPTRWRDDLWHRIDQTPNLDWLLLTKRIGNVAKMLPNRRIGVSEWCNGWPNVWLGISVVNQEEADRDIPKLLKVPARIKWLSVEPQIGPVSLRTLDGGGGYFYNGLFEGPPFGNIEVLPYAKISWVVCGGESSQGKHRARSFDLAWARDLRDQCKAAGCYYFFKQAGANVTGPHANGINLTTWRFKDRAGADPAEWPEDLRVRQWPR